MIAAREKGVDRSYATALMIVRVACVILFVARGWQHLFWGAPYRSLLWDESLMRGLIEGLGFKWSDFVSSDRVDATITAFIHGVGLFYFLCAAACVRVARWAKFEKLVLALGSASLCFLSFLYCKDRFFQVGQFLEYAAQFCAPFFLIWMVSLDEQKATPRLRTALKIAIGLTFASHGLYAIGYYTTPAEFVDMTIVLLRVNESVAMILLKIMGGLDFLLTAALFTRGYAKPALAYAVFWGIATALARVFANVSLSSFGSDLHQWLFEAIVRLPHGLIPLATFLILRQAQEKAWAFPDRLVRDLYREPVS